jgi:hypothetical protein
MPKTISLDLQYLRVMCTFYRPCLIVSPDNGEQLKFLDARRKGGSSIANILFFTAKLLLEY